MFGFLFGTACLIGLIAVARGGHRYRGFGRRHFGPRFFFHRVLDRLDTTPGQEKVIRSALHQLRDEAWTLKREAAGTRTDVAQALRGAELDHALLEQVFAKHDAVIARLREATLRATTQVHGALDERQRARLADMIEGGPMAWAWH
jgi:hypothetical protein